MRIFVYGSLRHKQGNSHWMTNAQLLGDFSIDNYQLYSLGHYPGAVPGNGTVHGEVYRIDNATLAELDALRTRGGEYARQLIQTPYGSAWMYVYQRPVDGLKLIESGDWLDRDGEEIQPVTQWNKRIYSNLRLHIDYTSTEKSRASARPLQTLA